MYHFLNCSGVPSIPNLLQSLQLHNQPTLRVLSFWCLNGRDVRAVTSLLCQCPNLSTLAYGCELEVSEHTEMDMWVAAVTGCRNLKEVRFLEKRSIKNGERSQRLLKNVLKKVSAIVDRSSSLKLNVVNVDYLGDEEPSVITWFNNAKHYMGQIWTWLLCIWYMYYFILYYYY